MPFGWVAGAVAVSGIMQADAASSAASDAADAQRHIGDQSAALGQQQLDFTKQQYADAAPMRQAIGDRALKISDSQLAGMDFANQQAQETAARNKGVFQPLENQLVSMAQGYDTPGRRAQAVAESTADVEQGFGSAQAGLNRTLGRMGIAPGGGRAQSLMQDAALQKGSAIAGATHNAVQGVEQQGWARMADAANLGRNLPSSQATQQQIATTAGNASNASSQSALNPMTSGVQLMQSGYNGAQSALYGAGSLYGQAGSTYAKMADSANQSLAGLGSIAGSFAGSPAGSSMIAGWLSDEKVKKGTGKRADGDKALAEVNALQVDEGWQYDASKGGPDDGQKRTGPMAQNVRAKMGEQAAPGGKVIDPITMNGKILASMQALTKRVARIEKKAA